MPGPRDPFRPATVLPGLAIAAALSAAIGIRIGIAPLLPILEAAPAWWVMIRLVISERRAAAVVWMLWWAACLGVAMTILCAADPWGNATKAVFHGASYYQEMRGWIETGAGCESSPACFLPTHALHAASFCVAALITAGAAALVMGAVLMNYMAYFVGSVTAGAVTPIGAAICAWFPWSLVRIGSFVILGVVLAEPFALRVARRPAPPGRGGWIAFAFAGLAADVLLKTWLSPHWPPLMRLLIHG